EGVAQHEGDALLVAAVGEPVPGEHALAGDDQAVAEGCDGAEEGVGAGGDALVEGGAAVAVEDAEGEGPGVEGDAGVESVRSVVEAHVMVSLGWAGPEPASWLEGTSFLKMPRCDKASP